MADGAADGVIEGVKVGVFEATTHSGGFVGVALPGGVTDGLA